MCPTGKTDVNGDIMIEDDPDMPRLIAEHKARRQYIDHLINEHVDEFLAAIGPDVDDVQLAKRKEDVQLIIDCFTDGPSAQVTWWDARDNPHRYEFIVVMGWARLEVEGRQPKL